MRHSRPGHPIRHPDRNGTRRGTVTEPYEALLALANILRSRELIDDATAKTLINATKRLPRHSSQAHVQNPRSQPYFPPLRRMPRAKMDFPQLQAEALGLARAIRRRDARNTSAALAFFYAQMHEYAILTPHAAHLIPFFLPYFGIEDVAFALLYLWDHAQFDFLPHAPKPTPDDEEPEP